jgi:hypothetical protein
MENVVDKTILSEHVLASIASHCHEQGSDSCTSTSPPLTDAADTESDDTENGEWKMTPQSKFVKDECCRLIRKGVCIPALARDEEIQGVHHRGHPRVVGRRQS